MLVKLHRPPPEIRIFLPARSARSSTATRRPRFPASAAQNSPAAPAPKTTTSNRRLIVESALSQVLYTDVHRCGGERATSETPQQGHRSLQMWEFANNRRR